MVSDPLQFEKSSQILIDSGSFEQNQIEHGWKSEIYYILPDHADTMFEPGFCKFYKTRVHTWYRRDPVQYNFKNRVKFI